MKKYNIKKLQDAVKAKQEEKTLIKEAKKLGLSLEDFVEEQEDQEEDQEHEDQEDQDHEEDQEDQDEGEQEEQEEEVPTLTPQQFANEVAKHLKEQAQTKKEDTPQEGADL